MIKSINVLLILVFSIILFSHIGCNTSDNPNCPGKGMWDRRLLFTNNSNQDVQILFSYDYPDTNSVNIINHSKYSRINIVKSTEDVRFSVKCDWNRIFNETENGVIMFYIFVDEGQDPHSQELLENHTLLKRYDLTIEDIEQMDWELVYE